MALPGAAVCLLCGWAPPPGPGWRQPLARGGRRSCPPVSRRGSPGAAPSSTPVVGLRPLRLRPAGA
eukprot:2874722-Lingulodinium_polyedra.AAC.1